MATLQQAVDLARQYQRTNRLAEAEAIYRQILAQLPNEVAVLQLLAVLLAQTGRREEGLEFMRRAAAAAPNDPDCQNNLGAMLDDLARHSEAVPAYRRAIELRPRFPEAQNNLGNALKDLGEAEQAIEAYRKATEQKPSYALAYHNLASALFARGDYEEALTAVRQCLALQPDFGLARCMMGLMLLLQGDLRQGWLEYEARWQAPELRLSRNFPQPPWMGEELDGKRILLHAEQGIGDSLQFFRYVPMVIARGGSVILECQPELVRLFQNSAGPQEIIAAGKALPAFDVHCPMLSLPRVFGTTLETIPAAIPYISADPEIVARWREKFPQDHRLKVGLAWAGRKQHSDDRFRSLSLSDFAPLAEVSGVWFCSLQKSVSNSNTAAPPAGMDLTDWTADLNDFADTAALIENLDLIISVDTAVVHLAGAMGKPGWVLLPHVPDWRWLLEREDSPWYPTLRLFRRPGLHDYDTPIGRIALALCSLVKSDSVKT